MSKKPIQQTPVAKTTLTAYDLSRLNDKEYAALMNTLVNQSEYVELMTKRNRVFKGLMGAVAGQDRTGIIKEIEKIDKKVKDYIFNSFVQYDYDKQKEQQSRNVTLKDYKSEFVKTPEQREKYESFTRKLDMAAFLGDMLESVLLDAQTTLKDLDPTCILSEVNAIKQCIEPLRSYTSVHHKNHYPELLDIYCDYADQAQEKLYPLCAMFVKEYADKVRELQAAGVIDKNAQATKY